jgi:hypothetical protein
MSVLSSSLEDFRGIADVVIVEWDDLIAASRRDENEHDDASSSCVTTIQTAIEQAYGLQSGIGIMAIRGVPGFQQAKDTFLPMAHTLATQLPESYRETHLTDPQSLYNAGWSLGKEKLGQSKPPDTAKGSFYYNPVTDSPGTEEDRRKYPCSYPCNIWPDPDRIPNFQENAIQLGRILKDVSIEIAQHLDVYVATKLKSLKQGQSSDQEQMISLHDNLKNTDKVKARLLYYFPLSQQSTGNTNDDQNDGTEDSWVRP